MVCIYLYVIAIAFTHIRVTHILGSFSRINPTMNGGGRLVLICGRTCRTLLGDKGKTLSGD